jgi:uncharacterized membrane protein YjgN (DUF898 family)
MRMSNQQTQIEFKGKAGEYFGIWIVNLLLSIVTLGIYSAWAKVRRKKYFYNNTLIDGVGFDYHARPIAILKGRIIAFTLFVLYQLAIKFSPILAGVLLILFLIALPWIFVRGLTFNARNSSHRGLRFDFDGNYGQAALVLLLYPMLIFITLGLAMPFVVQRMNQFIFNHHKFGISHFEMNAMVSDFYKIYLKLLGVVFLLGVIVALSVKMIMPNATHHASIEPERNYYSQTTLAHANKGGFIKVAEIKDKALVSAEAKNYLDSLTPEERADFELQMKQLELKVQGQAEAEEAKPEHRNPFESLANKAKQYGTVFFIAMLIPVLLYGVVIFSFLAYTKSRTTNLIWNHTTLEHISFTSHQKMRDLLWIYLSNMFILILTLGLATPWAQIRLARYHMEHIAVTGEANWDKFVGEKKEATRALGEEIADMFDVDLSFG